MLWFSALSEKFTSLNKHPGPAVSHSVSFVTLDHMPHTRFFFIFLYHQVVASSSPQDEIANLVYLLSCPSSINQLLVFSISFMNELLFLLT